MDGTANDFLSLAATPAAGATLLDARPALVFGGEGSRLLFANAAGAAFLGDAGIRAVLDRRFDADGPLARQIVRLAKSLPAEAMQTELLKFTFGDAQVSVTAQCRRLDLGDGGTAVLAIVAANPMKQSRQALAQKLVDAVATDDGLVAVVDRDGRAVGASRTFADFVAAPGALGTLIAAAAGERKSHAGDALPITSGTRDTRVVEFDAAGETLYLLMVGQTRAAAVAVLPAADEPKIERAAAPSASPSLPAVATVATPARPAEPGQPARVAQAPGGGAPLAFSEEDIDVAARKSIEEGRKQATPAGEKPEENAPTPAPTPEPPKRAAAAAVSAQRSNVVRMPGTPVRAFPPERLTGTEQDAFRRIAEALGVRMAEVRSESAEAGEQAAGSSDMAAAEARLLDKLPVGIIIYNDRRTIFANRSVLDLLGYATAAEFAAAGGAEAVFPEGAAATPTRGAKGEVNARKRDGSGVPVEARLHGIVWGEESAVMLSLLRRSEGRRDPLPDRGFIADLAAAGDRVEELEAILDTATDGVVVVNKNGLIDNFNRSAEALFGVAAKEVLGQPFAELFAEESRKAALDYIDGLAANGVASVLNDGREVIGKVPKGGLIPLFMTMGRISGGEKFCAVLRDITHWKNVEEELVAAKRAAESANAQKSEFLAKISHEIRTPLNAVIGFSEVMMEERFGPIENDRYRTYLRDIHVSGEHLLSLINDLLDLSKIEAGKVELTFEAVALNDIIQETVALMQPQANRQRIIIRTSLSTELPNLVADPRSIRQILLNLLSNAIKFTGPGGQVIVATALEENGEVELRIRDTGVGMSEKDLETAMKPFRQVGHSGDGTGLGLPLTKALVEANRADFAITSAPNQGTLIKVTFPTTRVLTG